jgi:hypothetical protein
VPKKKTKQVAKEEKIEELKGYLSEYKFQNNRKIINLVENKRVCAETTARACWRPDIYLDNDKWCNGCSLFEACACEIKRWNKKIS